MTSEVLFQSSCRTKTNTKQSNIWSKSEILLLIPPLIILLFLKELLFSLFLAHAFTLWLWCSLFYPVSGASVCSDIRNAEAAMDARVQPQWRAWLFVRFLLQSWRCFWVSAACEQSLSLHCCSSWFSCFLCKLLMSLYHHSPTVLTQSFTAASAHKDPTAHEVHAARSIPLHSGSPSHHRNIWKDNCTHGAWKTSADLPKSPDLWPCYLYLFQKCFFSLVLCYNVV